MNNFYTTKKLIGIFLLVNFLLINSLNAQVIKAFSQRTSVYTPSKQIYSIQGDYAMIGNTNLTLQNYGDFTNNSLNVMEYVDVDSDPNTFNSSSATLEYSTENGAIPECSRVIYAGLYWTGRASNLSSSPEEFSVTKGGITKTLNKRKVYLKGPGQTNYSEFVANPGNIHYPNGIQGNMYSGYVEVTDYIQNNGLGEYTLADIALIEGDGGATGYYGGWGMIVIYENSAMNWRDVTVFDGHAYVQGNASLNYELPISGFQTVQAGQVNMKVGVMAGEGDVGISGDYFRIRNWQDNQWITLSHSGNSTNNFFNSSVETGGTPRNPNLQNNTGLDISSFYIPNAGNTVITNDQTSTRFQYGSTQDTYTIFCIAMAVDAYVPDVESLVSTEYINGIPVGSGTVSATPGQLIDYKLEVRNKGTEAIDDMVVSIPVPYNTSFVPASIGTQVNFFPLPTPNNAYYDPAAAPTGSIVWDFGDLPMPPAGNTDSVLAEITFQLEVTTDCYLLTNPDCPPQVVLTGGNSTGVGAVSGADFDLPFIQGFEDAGVCAGEPITAPLIVNIDYETYVQDNCQGVSTNRDFVFCNYEEATLPVDSISSFFPSGLRFYNENNVTTSSIEYDTDNPFPAPQGTNTYFAIPDGVNFCYYTFTITVQDSIATSAVQTSQVSCPGFSDGSVDLSVNGGTSPINYAWTGPSGFTATSQDINSLEDGSYTVLLTDGLGCVAFDTAVVSTIPDLSSPSMLCQSNISINADTGACSYSHVGSLWDPQVSDNCNVASVSYSLSGATTGSGSSLDGRLFNFGITNVAWEATDEAGNTSTCSFSISINDNEDPIISDCGVIGSQIVNTDSGVCTYTNTGTGWDIIASDNCSTISVEYTLSGASTGTGTTLDGVTFNNGTTTVEWTVTDAAGNASTCTYDIVVEDNELPIISDCGVTGSQTVSTDLGTCTYTNTGTGWDVTATDNCTISSVGYTLTGATIGTGTTLDGTTFNNGTTTVVWTVTDAAGNASTCTYDIVVEDNELPIISDCGVTGAQTVLADPGVCSYTNTGTGWDVVATDNCTTITVGYTLSGATTGTGTTLDGVTFNNGTTTVEWTVTDAAGNISTCTYDIEVIDDQLPTITGCPSNVNATNDAGICGATVTWTAPTATDNCGVTNFTSTHNSGDVFPVGTTTVTYTATDDAGNVTTCSFDITISDSENPVINGCPSDMTVSIDAGTCGAVVTWAIPTANDNCGVDSFTSTHNSGNVFNVGTTTVTYTAVDAAGNPITCSFDVIVEDNENPTILCQPDVSVDADPGVCEADASGVNLGTPVTGDNCGVATVTNDAPASYPVGNTVVTWTVTDVHGNMATCTQNVDVEDTQAPIISGCGVSGSQTVIADAGVCTYTNTGTGWDVVATDNCITITIDYELTGATTGTGTTLDGVAFNNGTTTVTWTVTDDAGNTSICSYEITVNDEEAPAVVDCPTPITVSTDVNECGALVTWTPPTFTDNCTTVNVVSTHNPEDYFTVGTTTVTYTGTDAAGNQTQCAFDVIVNDTELPTIACQADIETCDSIVTYAAPTTDDNCGVANVTMIAGLASGSDFPVGTTTVTYEVEDIHGNTAQCSFNVTVFSLPEADIIATDVSCNGLEDGELDLTVTNGTAPYSFVWSNGSTDEDLTGLVPGTYDVVVTDDNGCTTADTASIAEPALLEVSNLVQDVLCNGGNDGSIDLTVTGGVAPYSYSWSNGSTDENLTGLIAGTYDVTVTDDNGCTVQSFIDVAEPDTIQVTYTSTPATCEAPNGTITIDVVGGTAPYTYNWSNGETTADLNSAVAGSYELTLTDDNGCTFVLQAEVESVSNLDASISSTDITCFGRNNGTATVLVNTGNGPYTYNWSNGETTASVVGLAAGSYEVAVTDNFGCQVTLSVDILQPDQITIDLFSLDLGGGYNVKPYDAQNGSITSDVFGGTAPYSFNWSTGDTTQNLSGLPAGNYNLVVTDENGCVANASITLTQPMTLEMPEGFSPNGDGDNDYFVVRGIDAYESNEIKIFNRWGNVVYQMNNYDNSWNGESNTGDQLPDATYFVILIVDTDDGGITLKGYVDLRRKY